MFSKLRKAFLTVRDHQTRPLHIEFNVTDSCNLNCRGCSHYSPLAPREFEPLDSLERSMRYISKAKNNHKIKGIYLMGGETLLYHQLIEAIRLSRNYFPEVKLNIFTNGLLIPKMSKDFWDCCRDCNAVIAITRYPIKFDYDNVEDICRNEEVMYEIFGDRNEEGSFLKLPLDPKKRQWKWLSHFRCCAFGCITVDNGRIFPCAQSACVRHLNNKFGTDFRWEPKDYIQVEELKNVDEILRLRNRPVPFCSYCKHQTSRPYAPSLRELSEWT